MWVRALTIGSLASLGVWHVIGWKSDIARAVSPGFSSGLGLGVNFYRVAPLFRSLVDAEKAHRFGVRVAALSPFYRRALGIIDTDPLDPVLFSRVFDIPFKNPVGLAAGFDKHAEAIDGLLDMGFGFVEIGSVTPLPQPGNPKPRVFRLDEDHAIINRYGFNSEGFERVANRMRARARAFHSFGDVGLVANRRGIVGINLGKNKQSEDAVGDYVKGLKALSSMGNYMVINVSSPNTPGLRALQNKTDLVGLLLAAKSARDEAVNKIGPPAKRPLLLKIAPDLTDQDAVDIANVCLEVGIDGLIVSNTTTSRPSSLQSPFKAETGLCLFSVGGVFTAFACVDVSTSKDSGLSGAPLFEVSTQMVHKMYQLTQAKIPIIGVGGVSNGAEAYAKIRAGASLVQLYSSFAFDGPVVVSKVKRELSALLKKDGFSNISQAVGADHRQIK